MKANRQKRIYIWTDGSYRPKDNTGGAGWVIHYPDGRKEKQSLSLPKLKDCFTHGSHIAELAAATHALNALPKGSLVTLHMDCIFALKSLQSGVLATKRYLEGASLENAFKKATRATRGQTIDFALASDRHDTQMCHAHRLSRQASEPPPPKNTPQ